MPEKTRIVAPGPKPRTVCIVTDGNSLVTGPTVLSVPSDWELLPPGDAGLTRRVKSRGPTWTVKEKKGRRVFSLGVWAPADQIAEVREELASERSTEAYQKRRVSDTKRREKKQTEYVEDFFSAVVRFLNFDERYCEVAKNLAQAVTAHATPVGSGTVARTQRIPIERRAESAVIAWLRHQTTAYDNMKIPREKGKRREVRRMLAQESKRLLSRYRHGESIVPHSCPLQTALTNQN